MCLNCGCGRAHDDMGDPENNITYETVKKAAEANGMSVEETLEVIAATARKTASSISPSTEGALREI